MKFKFLEMLEQDLKLLREGKRDMAEELVFFINNDSEINRKDVDPAVKIMKLKLAKDQFDPDANIRVWDRVVRSAAMKYQEEQGTPGMKYTDIFSKYDLNLAAEILMDKWLKEWDANKLEGF